MDFQKFVADHSRFYLEKRSNQVEFLEEFWRNWKVFNVVIHYFTNIMFLKDWCREKHPEVSSDIFLDTCALSHFNDQRGINDYMSIFLEYDRFEESIKWYQGLRQLH